MAQAALLQLDAVNGATARAWVKDGHKIFQEVINRLQIMAGFKRRETKGPTNDAKANRRALHARLAQMGARQ